LQTNSYAEGIPKNLANGLYELVEDSQTSPALQRSLVRKPTADGYPFTVGSDSVGITSSEVEVRFDQQAPVPSEKGQYYRLNLKFAPDKLIESSVLRFGLARWEHHSSYSPSPTGTGGGTSSGGGAADLLGQGVLLPSGVLVGPGAAFYGSLADGTPFKGTFSNRIGKGWTPVDGYGFINAQKAVSEPLP